MSSPTRHRPTRRELLHRVIGTLSPDDASRLGTLLEHERLAVELYGRAVRSRHISPGAQRLLRSIQAQERVHVGALAGAIVHPPHVRRPPAPESPAADEQIEAGLSRLRVGAGLTGIDSERGWFTLLEQFQDGLEGALYEALGQIASPSAATLVAQILGTEAQHQTLLFDQRHPGDVTLAVATPLVVGNAAPPQ